MGCKNFIEHHKVRNIGDYEMSESDIREALKKPLIDDKEMEDLDSDKYDWVILGEFYRSQRSMIFPKYRDEEKYLYQKYGRSAFCLKTGIRRTLTMGEWYGTGVVD
jgi:hypothetical protein